MSGSPGNPVYIFTRLKVKLFVQSFDSSIANRLNTRQHQVKDTIQVFLNLCSEVDKEVALTPWSLQDSSLPLRLPKSQTPLPTHQNVAQKYFHSINYGAGGSEMYFYFRLRHTVPLATLLNIDRPPQLELYVARLQASEAPCVGGFFVYSQKAYAYSSTFLQAMQRAVERVAGRRIDIGLFWAAVNCAKIGLRGPTALQIEVDRLDYDLLKRALLSIYNGRLQSYPLNIAMVFIPPAARCSDESLPKAACASHAKFLSVTSVFEFRCLKCLDLEKPFSTNSNEAMTDSSTTIRKILTDAKVDGKAVFHSVLLADDRFGSYVQLVALPGPGLALARIVQQSPVAYFRHFVASSELQEIFDQPSLLQGESETFDAVTGKIVNTDEDAIRAALNRYQFDLGGLVDQPPARLQNTTRFDDTLSFAPGSVQTHGSGLIKRTRFPMAYQNIYGTVPGASSMASGEGP